ncbi:MAG TPA: PH domain-containing protein [Candidatus Hydrogenedentes bacterium]|nr:PH domain-containing protein [Candidatus Hydrogenedentota bacterium]HNT88633.1 PH domain-containing protein [Candidatus Hydrogenedentota bacterium]
MIEGKKLLEVRPSLWNFTGWYLSSLILIAAAVAVAVLAENAYGWLVLCLLVIPLVVILWKRAAMRLTVFEDQVVSSRGVLSKTENHISCADVRAIETQQSLLQRVVNIGTVRIGTAGTEGWEEEVFGVPGPGAVKDLVLRQKRIQIEERREAHRDGE